MGDYECCYTDAEVVASHVSVVAVAGACVGVPHGAGGGVAGIVWGDRQGTVVHTDCRSVEECCSAHPATTKHTLIIQPENNTHNISVF